ncbi:MAG: methyltransferase [Myxococcota bacterium]
MKTPRSLSARLDSLGVFLTETRWLWAPPTFLTRPAWAARDPALYRWATQCSREDLDKHEASPERIPGCPDHFRDLIRHGRSLAAFSSLDGGHLDAPEWQSRHINGRKWSQIKHFGRCVLHHLTPGGPPIVDWCAGKGHLGRSLARWSQKTAHAIEWDDALCQSGRRLAEDSGMDVRFHLLDVRHRERLSAVPAGPLVALHACGDLHLAALRWAVEVNAPSVFVAPCCFHAIAEGGQGPLSAVGKRHGLVMDRGVLRLPSAEMRVPAPSRQRRRLRELHWRAGAAVLRRKATGEVGYRPLPSMPKSWFQMDFEAFIARVRERVGLTVPHQWDTDATLKRAAAWVHASRGAAMVRGALREPIEAWLVVDRARWLEERTKMAVRVGQLCPRSLTPRNLLIVGVHG